MKKILIISDGSVGEHFIKRTIETYSSENIYYVVQVKEKTFEDFNPARFKFYEFDPTSLYKISNLLKMEFMQVIIAMNSAIDVENTINNIRLMKKQLRIIVLNQWNLNNEDPNIILINSNEILASRLLDSLPNIPVIAQNVGRGEGEIMEVLVPFGSSFVYKHLGVIEQKNWRIVAIYRNKKLIMPSRRRMIQPNDLLLLVGDPTVLKSVYRAIKRELGQFPEPFGSNLYLFIDMDVISLLSIKEFIQNALLAHKIFEHTLIIRIINPSNIEILQYIKSYASADILVNIDYDSHNCSDLFFQDIKTHHIGLIMVSKEIFAEHDIRKVLYEAHVPVLKIADKEFSMLKDAALILTQNRDLEKISSTVFDISEKMNLNIELHNYMQEHQDEKEQVIEHFNNLATIFSKSIKMIEEEKNPILELKQKDNFVHILPFSKKITRRKILSLFATDSESLYHKLDEYYQIFIPVQL